MTRRPASELLRLPVRLNGILLGRPLDLLVDFDARRAIGLDVLCGDDARRFLPLGAADVREEAIVVGSPLTLLEESELRFYRDRASTLSRLRGAELECDGDVVGALRDVEIGPDGAVEGVVVEHGGHVRTIPPTPGLQVRARSAA
jgi:hypothetical protein